MRSRAIKKTKRISKHSSILCLLLMSILLMGIGYAAINSITGEISGTVIAEQQNDVFITSVEYVSDVEADLANSNITYYKGTYMQSTVKLSETNPNSEITYKVTVYNNSENTYPFLTTLFGEEFYDNPNIVFEIKDTGFKVGDLINGKETKEIYITFKYKDGVLPENKTLNSNINFKIANPNRLKKAEYGGSTSNYLGSTITRDKIETVKFELGTLAPEGTVASFDASEKQDGSIIGYYTDTDGNGMYELTFLSAEPIAPNVNGQYLFQYLTNATEITFNNFTTYGVTSMYSMFENCSGLTELDVSGFDTSQVTSMISMFYYCSGLTELDVGGFDTSQVTNMISMFYNCSKLTKLDVSGFDTSKVTSMGGSPTNYGMFSYCRELKELNISTWDTSKVTNMENMFNYCESLIGLDLGSWNTSQVTSMRLMFYNCSGLTELNVSGFDTSKVTNMNSMFYNCSKLTELDVTRFDTSQVTDMSHMFRYCNGLTSLDLSRWDTSQVTSMRTMFYSCSGLTELDVSGFDTSQVKDMESMFSRCSKLTELDVSNFDTSQVTSMETMFQSCSGLTELDVSGFNTNQVTNMSSMFSNCSGLTTLDLSSFDTRQVTNMSNMFYYCSKLTTIYVSEYDEVAGTGWTTSAVTSSSNMFYNCTKLVGQNGTIFNGNYTDKTYARIDKPGEPGYLTLKINRLVLAEDVDSTGNYLGSTVAKDKIESVKFEKGTTMEAISSFDASEKQDGSVIGYYTDTDNDGLYELTFLSKAVIAPNINAYYLFENLINVKEIIFNNFTTYGVESMYYMFFYCSQLTSLDLSSFNTSQVTSMDSMFLNCNKLMTLDLNNFDTSQVNNMSYMFYECSSLTNLIISNFNTSKVTNMPNLFYKCESLTELDVSGFDTSKVNRMDDMFYKCKSLTELDVSGFNTSQATDMQNMFRECTKLTKLDLSRFNTSQVSNMSGMFYNCSELTSLNLSSFNTSQITDMSYMFYYCSGLTELDVSGFNTSQVTDMSGMFRSCSGLTSLDVSGFDTSQVTSMSGMFQSCSGLTSLDVSEFDTSQVTSMNGMFYSCSGLTELDVTGFDTSQVTNMSSMFYFCTKLTSLDVSRFYTSKTTVMRNMFQACTGLTQLDVSSFDTRKVTNMYGMFWSCSGLTELDLSSFDTSQVTDMGYMFNYCSGLTTIYVSEYDEVAGTGWTTSAVTNSSNMFSGCTKLVGQNGTAYSSSYTDKTYARIDKSGAPGYLTDINKPLSPSELFDSEGTNPDGLHIGDFVNYDAGTWTEEEINSIQTGEKGNLVTANGKSELPTERFQFGGFTVGSSRNENVIQYRQEDYNFVKDAKSGEAITGWRIFDVEGDTVTLISAGNPENYYHYTEIGGFSDYNNANGGYISEYILTGNINSKWNNGTTKAGNYQKRNWDMYINGSQYGKSAGVLTKEMLDKWYAKYITTSSANTETQIIFQRIYTRESCFKYQNIIDNYTFYWLASSNSSNSLKGVFPQIRRVSSSSIGTYGVRVLITLTTDAKFEPTKAGTKTVTGGWTTQYGGDQTYNVWDIY